MANYLAPIQIINTFNSYDFIGTTIIPIKWVPPNTIPIIATVPVASAKTASISAPVTSAPVTSAPVSAPVTPAPVTSAPVVSAIVNPNPIVYTTKTGAYGINQTNYATTLFPSIPFPNIGTYSIVYSIVFTSASTSSTDFSNISLGLNGNSSGKLDSTFNSATPITAQYIKNYNPVLSLSPSSPTITIPTITTNYICTSIASTAPTMNIWYTGVYTGSGNYEMNITLTYTQIA